MSRDSRCPACQIVVMGRFTDPATGLEIDACPTCEGMWFDAHELGAFLKSPTLKSRFLLPEAAQPQGSVGYTISTRQRVCPRCREGMDVRVFEGVVLDVCHHCHGIWFDAGEVRDVVERFREGNHPGDPIVDEELRQGLEREGPLAHAVRSFMKLFKGAVSR